MLKGNCMSQENGLIMTIWVLEPVCCKKRQKIVLELIRNESKLFPWSSRISLVPFRTFRGPLLPKPVNGQELFFDVSYIKPDLGLTSLAQRQASPFEKFCWKAPHKSSCILFGIITSNEILPTSLFSLPLLTLKKNPQ